MYGKIKKREPKPLERPLTPADMREMFPQAQLLCQCVEDRDTCPPGCSFLKESRAEIRSWLAGAASE